MNKYDLAIFDFDGTICSTRNAIVHCIKRTFEIYSKPIPEEAAIQQTVNQGISMQETFIRLNTKIPDLNTLEEWVITYRTIYLKEGLEKTEIFSGANEIFSRLYLLNIPIIIVSNKGETAINAALKYFELSQFAFLVIGDRPKIKKKPDSTLFDEIIRPHFNHIKREKILVIGDTAIDLQFANNINSHSCWARFGYGNYDECISHKPTFIINNLLELKDIF